MKTNKSKLVIYKVDKNDVELEVSLWKDSIWLNQAQIADLFDIDRTVITKHLGNIFQTKELNKKTVCAIFAHTAADGKKYQTQFFNLDVVISVGYRVNSKKATQFRIWATKVLRQHILQGYTINEKRLLDVQSRFNELQGVIAFLQSKANKINSGSQELELLDLLADYSKTMSLLSEYDKGMLAKPKGKKDKYKLKYLICQKIISGMKKKLVEEKEAGNLFGNEIGRKLEAIIENLYQTFDKKDLYKCIEEKAANLIYLIIKDHPFSDGNKRIASYLFVYFLDRNDYLFRESGEKKINDNALVALALLIAESDPSEKDVLIKIIVNLITGN